MTERRHFVTEGCLFIAERRHFVTKRRLFITERRHFITERRLFIFRFLLIPYKIKNYSIFVKRLIIDIYYNIIHFLKINNERIGKVLLQRR
jgi:hypothetical protein